MSKQITSSFKPGQWLCSITPDNITELKPGSVFVYGSNEAGINGAAAAYFAEKKLGAKHGIGFGWSGENCFAIPTKDHNIETLPLNVIEYYVGMFLKQVIQYPDKHFLITAIGTGLASLQISDIAPMFHSFLNIKNCSLPESFINYLTYTR